MNWVSDRVRKKGFQGVKWKKAHRNDKTSCVQGKVGLCGWTVEFKCTLEVAGVGEKEVCMNTGSGES